MNYEVIGERIRNLRLGRGFSQIELAVATSLDRTSLAKIERGQQRLSAETLVKLSAVLEVSIDDLLSPNYRVSEPLTEYKKVKAPKAKDQISERVAIPSLQVAKFKQILLYVLERCSGKANVGETVLNKLMYFIEFNYYEQYEEHLIGSTFKKQQFGPVPQKMSAILAEMEKDKMIKTMKTEYHGLTQKRFIPLCKPDLTKLTAAEIEVIDHVIAQLSDYSAKAISDYSHRDLPWKATKAGEVIDYELAFYREPPFTARIYDNDDGE